jgi:hypothetical protein
MKGDFSRDSFDPSKHFSRVLMQQGRVQLDADWNEQNAILLHYVRTLAKDILGPHAGPAEERDRGFQILAVTDSNSSETRAIEDKIDSYEADSDRRRLLKEALNQKNFIITPGRYYVEGILVENDHTLLYTEQLGMGSENQPELHEIQSHGGHLLFYLDVWERHVTHVEYEHTREVALGGPDTCSRSQVVWQVKVLFVDKPSNSKQSSTAIPPEICQLPQLGTGKLRARVGESNTYEDQLCVISPQSRYRGAENQLYRVEIHRGGRLTDANSPTFKWSRDNASVIFPISELSGGTAKLGHLGRDEFQSLAPGDWVEIMDERVAMGTQAGPLAKVQTVQRSDLTVTLQFADDSLELSYSHEQRTLRPFLRRWDYSGDGKFNGALEVKEPADLGDGWIDLEDGLQIRFEQDGEYRTGDYWLIPARVVTGKIEWPGELDANGQELGAALGPHGQRHYYAPLGLINLNEGEPVDYRLPIGAIR